MSSVESAPGFLKSLPQKAQQAKRLVLNAYYSVSDRVEDFVFPYEVKPSGQEVSYGDVTLKFDGKNLKGIEKRVNPDGKS